MIILRPSGSAIGVGQVCALLSAMIGGLTSVLVKQLTARDDPDKIVFLTNAMLLPLSLMPALFVWHWPELEVLPALIGMGVCAVLGHVCVVRGYAATDASLALTFEFSKLSFAVGIAYLAFGEVIDAWTWVGAVIIFASAGYITRREARLSPAGVRRLPSSRSQAFTEKTQPDGSGNPPKLCNVAQAIGRTHLERHTWKGTLGKAHLERHWRMDWEHKPRGGGGSQSANERNGRERMGVKG
jgi:uncharacterized membrane protein